jgi:hypothetical protein
MKLYGIWDCICKDWLRELPWQAQNGVKPILAFESKRNAQRRAALYCGPSFSGYSDAKRKGWCEVRPL